MAHVGRTDAGASACRDRGPARPALPARPAAPAPSQRLVQVILGVLWVGDGLLQLQPPMFGRGFVTGTLLPAARANPAPVAGSISAMARFLEPHLALWNALFAATQLAIGVGLLVPRTVRPALAGSFAWSLLVWWFAEGLGGLLTGTASPLVGAPGAALLYVVVGLLAWPSAAPGGGPAERRRLGVSRERAARAIWAGLWVGSAALAAQPASLASGSVRSLLVAAAVGQPGWYATILTGAARVLGPYGLPLTLAVIAEMALVGVGVALGWHVPALLGVATVLALVIWVLPEGLGGILTGTGTDPNTGPLLALVALSRSRSLPELQFSRLRATAVPSMAA